MGMPCTPDVNFITAYPKSGITFLSYMLFHAIFERPDDLLRIHSDYIIDIHHHLDRATGIGSNLVYVKSHFAFGPDLPLHRRGRRAIVLVRDPIDVMMSAWDYKHLTGENNLHLMREADRAPLFHRFVAEWLSSGGRAYPWADSWVNNVDSWLDQSDIPFIVTRYERLKQHPAQELRRILDFLDRPATDDQLAAAVAFGDVERMRASEEQAVAAGGGIFAGHDKGYRFIGRLHQDSYRTVLDDAQRDRADTVFGPTLEKIAQHIRPLEN